VDFRILGPLEAVDGGVTLELGGRKRRALLARLLLDAGRTVSVERLVDDLWGDAPPPTATKMVQVHVSRLRRLLPEGVIETRAPGYLLVLRGEDGLDLRLFEKLLADGREALSHGEAARATELLRNALALWRGPALAEFSEPFAAPEAGRLEELRLVCLEELMEAKLALGRHAELVGELELLVERHPLRERLRGQLMRALYGAGRQAEALAAYRAFRERLADELGIEPSAALKDLERRMLRQDPTLAAPSVVPPAPVPVPPEAAPAAPGTEEISYARSGDVSIAYQVVGDGPLDLVLVHGWICTFQPGWENPRIARFYRRLASLGRLILFDKRGTGLSDRVALDRLPDLETRMDDVRAVMDATGSERAVVLGVSEGGPMSVLFAATHPERTAALVLIGTFARMRWAPDYPIGITDDVLRERLAAAESDEWPRSATLEWLGRVAPRTAEDEEQVRWYVSYLQRGASPAATRALRLMNQDIDVRHVLPAVAVPTLALYRRDEYYAPARKYMGDAIPGARVVELLGDDHLPWEGDQDALLDEIERFLGEVRGEVEVDRVLATVLFTDVVGSTAKAAEVGDRAWRALLERHFAVIRAQLARFRGREVDTSGDGIFAVFDGPARAVRCGSAIVRAVRPLGLDVRVGVHTGEVELAGSAVQGLAVHIGARVAALAGPGEVLVSQTVKDLVAGSGLEFGDRGSHVLKGVPGEWRLLAARDPVSA
jgi:DNA-binding SARP family transcriptional activator/pimeloyl-ACP methyl ester carboxylesterase